MSTSTVGEATSTSAQETGSSADSPSKAKGEGQPVSGQSATTPNNGTPRTILRRDSSDLHGSSGHRRVKRVSFGSAKQIRMVSGRACLKKMSTKPTDLVKIRQRGHYPRTFTLDEDLTGFRWRPSNKKSKARVAINEIHEVRRGKNSELFLSCDIDISDDCAFSVIHGPNFESLDLVAETPEDAHLWVTGLQYLLNRQQDPRFEPAGAENQRESHMRDQWLAGLFEEADSNNDGWLDEEEVIRLCRKINVGLPESQVRLKFREADSNRDLESNGRLDHKEFKDFVEEIATRQEIFFLLMRFGNGQYMTCEQLLGFLQDENNEDVTMEDCIRIIKEHEPTPIGRRHKYLTVDGFTRVLLSPLCSVMNPAHHTVHHDMNRPLTDYFIASSHNTYLTEDQVHGPASLSSYVHVLILGCRYLEIDLWDGPSDEPVVKQNKNAPNSLRLDMVLKTIAEHAFTTSKYPLIVRLENHCSVPQQVVAASLFTNFLGDYLCEQADLDTAALPSPESLKCKVLILGRKLDEEQELVEDGDGCVTEDDDASEVALERTAAKVKPAREQSVENNSAVLSVKHNFRLSRLLSQQVVHLKSVTPNLSSGSLKSEKCSHVWSVSEDALATLLSTRSIALTDRHRQNLTRVYPATTRTDSSNYIPTMAWSAGVQCAALNYQTIGSEMDVANGLFQANGQCGYYLKPELMRNERALYDSQSSSALPGVLPVELSVKVISGQHLPKPIGGESRNEVIDPYVKVAIYGLNVDYCEQITRSCQGNGFNPVWEESFTFIVNFPEFALLRFAVLDYEAIGNDFIGQYTLPLSSLQPGYRHVHLLNVETSPLVNASLFVHISMCKAGRRLGSVVRVTKKSRKENLAIRPIGVKDIDTHFKRFSPLLSQCVDLTIDAEAAIVGFKDACGLSSKSSVRECFRVLASRSRMLNISVEVTEELYPVFSVAATDPQPDIVRRALSALQQGMSALKAIIQQAEQLASEMRALQRETEEKWCPVHNVLSRAGLVDKRLARACESFAWNLGFLTTEREELLYCRDQGISFLKQVPSSAYSQSFVRFDKLGELHRCTPSGSSTSSSRDGASPVNEPPEQIIKAVTVVTEEDSGMSDAGDISDATSAQLTSDAGDISDMTSAQRTSDAGDISDATSAQCTSDAGDISDATAAQDTSAAGDISDATSP